MQIQERDVATIKGTGNKEQNSTTEETIIRFKNVRRPRKADRLNLMTDSKQSLVGDYSCCSAIP